MAVLLEQYGIKYVPQKAIKWQALTDFFVAHPVTDGSTLVTDLPDDEIRMITPQKRWEMYFDGISRSPTGAGKEDTQDNLLSTQSTRLFLIPSPS